LNNYYFCLFLKFIGIFKLNKYPLNFNNIKISSCLDVYSFSDKRYGRYSNFFESLKFRKNVTSIYSLVEISEILLLIYILWDGDIYLLTEISFAFSCCLFNQYQYKLPIEFLLGQIVGSFCELSEMNIDFIINFNILILKLIKSLSIDFFLREFLQKKMNNDAIKCSLIFFISQFQNYQSTEKKAEIFDGLFKAPLKIKDLKLIINDEPQNLDKKLSYITDAFIFCFFLPFLDQLKFSKEEKEIFFNIWDKKGFFRYILYRKNFLSFFNIEIRDSRNEILDLFKIDKELKLNEYFYFKD